MGNTFFLLLFTISFCFTLYPPLKKSYCFTFFSLSLSFSLKNLFALVSSLVFCLMISSIIYKSVLHMYTYEEKKVYQSIQFLNLIVCCLLISLFNVYLICSVIQKQTNKQTKQKQPPPKKKKKNKKKKRKERKKEKKALLPRYGKFLSFF